jgi:hypothetical protein
VGDLLDHDQDGSRLNALKMEDGPLLFVHGRCRSTGTVCHAAF